MLSNLIIVQFFLPLYFSLLLVPNIFFLSADISSGSDYVGGVRIFLLIWCCVLITISWMYFIVVFVYSSQRKYAYIFATVTSGSQTIECKTEFQNRIEAILEKVLLILSTLLFAFLLIYRSFQRSCDDGKTVFIYVTDPSCNPYKEVNLFPVEIAIILMVIPLTCSLLHKHERIIETLVTWGVVMISLVTSAVAASSTRAIIVIVVYFFFSLVCISENYQLQNVSKHLKSTLQEEMRTGMEEGFTEKDKQTKDMIGNVAHDLKTVSSFFLLLVFVINTFIYALAACFIYSRSGFHSRLHFSV
jgi:hypothetical protein